MQAHIQQLQDDAEKTIREWEANLKEDELAEKRRVAPGWLDRDEKILQPTRNVEQNRDDSQGPSANIMDQQMEESAEPLQQPVQSREGDELDRAFGGMRLGQK